MHYNFLTITMKTYNFLAFDLGATSGRTILGELSEGKLSLKELTRFPNQILPLQGHYYWNIFSLYEHLRDGLMAAAKEEVEISSIGIDTWGVDFAFIGNDGSVMGLPYAYRDPQTKDAPEQFFEKYMSKEDVYARTGIQVMNFNSLYQLYAMQRDGVSQLSACDKLLFMPDALSYMLTGEMVTEYTIASTSQMINPYTKKFDKELLECVDLRADYFARMVMPSEKIGVLTRVLAEECGLPQIPVVAVAGHDTASAIASVPAVNPNFAYLSSGTWSLMGIEVQEPIISQQTAEWNITNEGGVDGTIRLLKNITGMWIVEQCLKEWKKIEFDYTYSQMVELAKYARPFVVMIDPDDVSFANPSSMLQTIDNYCERTNQTKPKTHGEYIRSIFESLALKYRSVLEMLAALAPFPIEKLHIIGGGSRNVLLNQFTSNATGLEVVAGPSEATAIGNIMLQAKAAGIVGDLWDMRRIIASTVDTRTYLPNDVKMWDDAYNRYKLIIK